MPNPKTISSYDPQLVMIIGDLAQTTTPTKVGFDFANPNRAITFASRFSSLRKLMAEQAEKAGNFTEANRLYATRLRRKDHIVGEDGKKKTIAWYICNPEEANKTSDSDVIRAAFEELMRKKAEAEGSTQRREEPEGPPPSPLAGGHYPTREEEQTLDDNDDVFKTTGYSVGDK